MKIPRKVMLATAVLAAPILLWNVISWWGHLPKPSFRRHFGSPIPSSVQIQLKWGGTALAGSSEYIVFTASKSDIELLIQRQKLKEIDLTGSAMGWTTTDTLIDPSNLNRDIFKARENGIQPSKAFIGSKYSGLVYYLLILDKDGEKCIFHYYKS